VKNAQRFYRPVQLFVRRCGFVVAALGKACLLIPCLLIDEDDDAVANRL
jgi:hypothetical protein